MNFKEFEELFKSGVKRITLTEDVILETDEKETYEMGVEINENGLIINGNGHAIDGNAQVSLLCIKAEVTLKNIVFKNAYCEYSGGAIINGGDLMVENLKVEPFTTNQNYHFMMLCFTVMLHLREELSITKVC